MDTAQPARAVKLYGDTIIGRNLVDANPRARQHREKMDTAGRTKRIDLRSMTVTERSKEGCRYNEVMEELGKVKRELSSLNLDVASASMAKANAEKEAEASRSRAVYILQSVEELRKQIDESDEEHVLVELARIEAEREYREIETQRAAEAAEFAKRIEAARKMIEDVREEISHYEELELELAITNSAISVLQTELESVGAKGRSCQNYLDADDARKRELERSLLEAAKAELLAAKQELASVKEEGFQFMNSMDRIREELIHIAAETSQLKKLEKKAESSVVQLNSKLVKAKTKLETMTMADERTRTMASNLSAALQQLQAEAEAARKEKEVTSEETDGRQSQIMKTDSEISWAEEKLQAAVQELCEAKASEATAFKKLKSLAKRSMRARASSLNPFSPSSITISRSEHDYLIGKAQTAQTVANKKVAAAQTWVEALTDREKKVVTKAELIEKEIRDLRAVEVRELYETQRSVFSRKSLEEEVNKMMMMEKNAGEEDSDEEEEDEEDTACNLQILQSSRGEAILMPKRSRSIKMRRIPSSPAMTRHVRSPLIVIKKRRRKVMPNLVKYLRDRREAN